MHNRNDYIANFRSRVLEDALTEATRKYWLRRAKAFEEARPRPGDYVGQATPEQRRERWERLTAIAQACRARAEVCDEAEIVMAVRDVLAEVA